MNEKINRVTLLIGTVVLAGGLLFLFFGGTWDGVRFGLEIFGAVYILQLCYSVMTEKKK
ncbi:hypothetical protein KKD19_00405 [Patescibacteria group bacterium]|nr:hypothetical protein [Patescibacteria group bacterium]MCG2688758.1 hypothetical protein [Candidatus Parcubacteria bacterium]